MSEYNIKIEDDCVVISLDGAEKWRSPQYDGDILRAVAYAYVRGRIDGGDAIAKTQ